MTSKTSLDKLDEVLRELGTPKTFEYLQSKYHYKDDAEINKSTLEQIIEKLRDDGYVYVVDDKKYITTQEIKNPWYVRRSFNGEIFLLKKGYLGQHKREIRSKFFQALQTWLIVIGTLLAGIYGVFEIWKYFFR